MGRGNWLPSDVHGCTAHDAPLVYADVIDLMGTSEGERDEQFYEDAWENFKNDLQNELGTSFDVADDADRKVFAYSRDTQPLFSNRLCYLVIDAQAESHHQGIAFVPRENAPAFVNDYIAKAAKKLFDQLAEWYHLSFRDGAWMSSSYPIQPKESPVAVTEAGQ